MLINCRRINRISGAANFVDVYQVLISQTWCSWITWLFVSFKLSKIHHLFFIGKVVFHFLLKICWIFHNYFAWWLLTLVVLLIVVLRHSLLLITISISWRLVDHTHFGVTLSKWILIIPKSLRVNDCIIINNNWCWHWYSRNGAWPAKCGFAKRIPLYWSSLSVIWWASTHIHISSTCSWAHWIHSKCFPFLAIGSIEIWLLIQQLLSFNRRKSFSPCCHAVTYVLHCISLILHITRALSPSWGSWCSLIWTGISAMIGFHFRVV